MSDVLLFLSFCLTLAFPAVDLGRYVNRLSRSLAEGRANLYFTMKPMLIQGPNTLSTGGDFTINGPFQAAIAYVLLCFPMFSLLEYVNRMSMSISTQIPADWRVWLQR